MVAPQIGLASARALTGCFYNAPGPILWHRAQRLGHDSWLLLHGPTPRRDDLPATTAVATLEYASPRSPHLLHAYDVRSLARP
jgi:hypothetical protein